MGTAPLILDTSYAPTVVVLVGYDSAPTVRRMYEIVDCIVCDGRDVVSVISSVIRDRSSNFLWTRWALYRREQAFRLPFEVTRRTIGVADLRHPPSFVAKLR